MCQSTRDRGEGGLTGGVGILYGTDAAVLGWVGVSDIQVGAQLIDWGNAWVVVGDIVVTIRFDGLASIDLGVISWVFTNFCSYGEVGDGVSLLVWITADSGDRLGEIMWNMFCWRSLFQYRPSGLSVKVFTLYTEVASSCQIVSWSRGGHRGGVTLGRGLGLGCWCLHCMCACWLIYSHWQIVGKLGLAAGSWNVIGDIEVGVASPVYMMVVGGSFVDRCF